MGEKVCEGVIQGEMNGGKARGIRTQDAGKLTPLCLSARQERCVPMGTMWMVAKQTLGQPSHPVVAAEYLINCCHIHFHCFAAQSCLTCCDPMDCSWIIGKDPDAGKD